jgi:hypothetical protein
MMFLSESRNSNAILKLIESAKVLKICVAFIGDKAVKEIK